MTPRDRQLAAVFEARRRVERDKQRAVAELERRRLGIEDTMRASSATFNSIRNDLREALAPTRADGLRFADVRAGAGASLHARLRLQSLAIELAGVHERLGRARGELRAAAASRQAVELLIERRRAERVRIAERREAEELDEISTVRASRADDQWTEVF